MVLNVCLCPQSYAIAIAYGRESDWVRNVLHSGDCDVVTLGNQVHLGRPRVVVDETRRLVPVLWPRMLRWLKSRTSWFSSGGAAAVSLTVSTGTWLSA